MFTTDGTIFPVTQFPARVTPVKGTNVSICCTFSLFDRKAWVDVHWWREDQNETLNATTEKNKIITSVKPGSAELHLVNVSFQDSGVYYCKARDWSGKISNGTGTELIVHVPPTPLKVTHLSSPSLALFCTTAGFFPGEFNLTWYKNGFQITSGINITESQNEEGLYQVSSSLSPVESESDYTCQVSHISLRVPANNSYTVRGQGDGDGILFYALVSGCVGSGLIILLLVIFVKRWKLERSEGTEISEDIPGQFEEQILRRGKAGSLSYAALRFSGHREAGKTRREKDRTVYAQTKQGTDVNLTYASLDFPCSYKMARRKQKRRGVEYSEIKINKPSIEVEIV
ncbi:tapasin-related protein-like isoform X2 [Heterodontus francisci]|uniref:tapasin-related protein-like isoform X2 n=1 Tax=Heterodontus francisci TaxID=7792 RepID=UPI00355B48B2